MISRGMISYQVLWTSVNWFRSWSGWTHIPINVCTCTFGMSVFFFCGEVALRDDELIDKRNQGKNWLHVECQNVLGQYLTPVCSWVSMNLFRLSFISVFSSLTSYYQHCKPITFLVMAASLTLSWPKCLEMPPHCLYVSVPTLSTHMCVLIVISVGMINCTIL